MFSGLGGRKGPNTLDKISIVGVASFRQPLSMEPLPFPCHPDRSEAERRDLRFYGPFLEMFFTP